MKNGDVPDGGTPTVRTPSPESVPTQALSASEYQVADLSADPLLRGCPRMPFQGREVPSLGGIPLVEKLGQGGMGAVYRGVRVMLQQEVAVKVLPMQMAAHQEGLRDRFIREAQIASRIESPHLVRVSDVNEHEGIFYLIMEYVRGISVSRLISDARTRGTDIDEAIALDICIAASRGLAAAHVQGVVHRDVKPDNILIPVTNGALAFASAKLADLGLARSEADRSLTASSIGMGTPGYMSPEQAMSARRAGKPADVFGMGATLYALLAGHAPFTGDSTAAIIIATVQQPHPPIREAREGVSEATALLLDQCLRKNPDERFHDASALADALQTCRSALSNSETRTVALETLLTLQQQPEAGSPVRVTTAPPSPQGATQVVTPARKRRWSAIAAIALVALILAAFFAWKTTRPAVIPAIGVVSGPEQSDWLQWAATEFAKTEAGKGSTIRVLPMPDSEAQNAIIGGNRAINVWIPMSSMTRGVFEQRWKSKYGALPIARAEVLGVTPHAFLMLKSRYEPFAKKYGEITFATLRAALNEPGGWGTIAGKPAWGKFTFAMTQPSRYSGGLAALTLMAFDFHRKDDVLSTTDVTSAPFVEWARGFERAFAVDESPAQAMRSLVLKGPSKYDGIFTYESSIIQDIEDIEDRWGPVQLVYPPVNIWSESTYYVLSVPWSTDATKKVANDFADFLLSEVAQKRMVMEGFRPANPRVRTHSEGSPFARLENRGIQREIDVTVATPPRQVVAALLKSR